MFINAINLAGVIGPVSSIFALLALTSLSYRIGTVMRMPKLYRFLIISVGLATSSVIIRLALVGTPYADTSDGALLANLPMALALALAVWVCYRYWGWLLHERTHEAESNANLKK